MSEPCPKCGSARTQFEGRTSWECGSYQSLIGGSHIRFPAFRLIESELCTCRQEITRLTAELAAANREIERLRSEMTNAQLHNAFE